MMDGGAAGHPENVNITAAVIDSKALALSESLLMLFSPPAALLQPRTRLKPQTLVHLKRLNRPVGQQMQSRSI